FIASSFLAAWPLPAQEAESKPAEYSIEKGTKVPLSLINSVSTKHSIEGDRVYLETVFPVLVNGRIVVPVGSYVAGTVTQVKKPGRVKRRGGGRGGRHGRGAAFARTGRRAGERDHARNGAGPGAELQRKRAEFRGLPTAAHGEERGTARRTAEEPFIHTTAGAPVSGIGS